MEHILGPFACYTILYYEIMLLTRKVYQLSEISKGSKTSQVFARQNIRSPPYIEFQISSLLRNNLTFITMKKPCSERNI